MKKLLFDSVLLFALVIPFIMGYRIGPAETPYWLFGIIFFLLLLYITVDLFSLTERIRDLIKHIFLWIIIVVVIGSAFSAAIIVRHQTAPVYMIHDIILQQEAAIRFLLDGKNPYAEDYFNTPLAQWHYSDTETNPALYHFVMEPWYLLFAIPFYGVSNHTIGYFDGRIPLLVLFFILLVAADILVKKQEEKRTFLVLLAFHPAILPYTLEGRSDIFMFAFLFVGLLLLFKNRVTLSGIALALAFAVKQSSWLLFPFYLYYLYRKNKSARKTAAALIPFIITLAIIVLPFFFWNQKAFIDSTIHYLSGSTHYSYPVSGYGLGMMLHQFGVIKDVHNYYPFVIWQALIVFPLLAGLLFYLRKHCGVRRVILSYGIFLFVYWYLSRYLNNSHLAYISLVFTTAYFWPLEESSKE